MAGGADVDPDRPLVERFSHARRDPDLVLLEGFHALKHALRFGAGIEAVVTPEPGRLATLVRELAPDLVGPLRSLATEVGPAAWDRLVPGGLPSPCLAIARRPPVDVEAALADPRPAPAVLLEEPTHLGNLGAVIRVAAAAAAAAVVSTGDADPWHPTAVRAAAGLHFAVPVARVDDHAPRGGRPLVAVDPGGRPLEPGALPPRPVLAFGTERGGLSGRLLDAADAVVGIPMRAGVSSLNLATAVAVVLYVGAPPGSGSGGGGVH